MSKKKKGNEINILEEGVEQSTPLKAVALRNFYFTVNHSQVHSYIQSFRKGAVLNDAALIQEMLRCEQPIEVIE